MMKENLMLVSIPKIGVTRDEIYGVDTSSNTKYRNTDDTD